MHVKISYFAQIGNQRKYYGTFTPSGKLAQGAVSSKDFTLSPASADASFRRYFRVTFDDGTLIAMDAPPEQEDCASFLARGRIVLRGRRECAGNPGSGRIARFSIAGGPGKHNLSSGA